MATYKEIKGVTIQTLDSDPVQNVGSWASSTAANTPREELGAGGTATAAIVIGGQGPPSASPRTLDDTEIWNGSSWTEVNNLNTDKKNQAGAGTTTSALSSSGQDPGNDNSPLVEQWNGSSWTEVAEVNTARRQLAGSGISGTAALIFFGYGGSPETFTNVCESWNGSTWTEVGDTNTGRVRGGSFGTYTSAIGAGGSHDGSNNTANSESWNGTAWTETNNLNTARRDMSSHGSGGSNTDGLIFAGYSGTANLANTESWDGTSWTEIADLATSFRNGFGSQQGSGTSAIAGLGFSTTYATQVEEFSFPPPTSAFLNEGMIFLSGGTELKGFQKGSGVPTGSFSSGGALNTARYTLGGCGNSTAAIAAGGDFYVGPPNSPSDRSGTKTESYNGTSWTEVNDMNNDVQGTYAASGTYTAALAKTNTDSPKSFIESWDGTSWTNAPDINSPRGDSSIPATGSQTATLLAGGYHNPSSPKSSDLVEQYNGSSWSEITEINSGRYANRNVGTSTDNLLFGGYTSTYAANTEIWNGTAWTELNDLPVGRTNHAGFGGSSLAVTVNGNGPNSLGAPNPTGANSSKAINFWNGTSWSADADDAPYKARGVGCGGSATDGIVFGGISDPNFTLTTTIEWNVDAAIGTVTLS